MSDNENISTHNRPISRTYKQPLTKVPAQSFVTLASLYDLMFYEEDGYTISRYVPEKKDSRGMRLKHTTICFDENIYFDESERFIRVDADSDWPVPLTDFFARGFDISIPVFDTRAKPMYVHKDNAESIIKKSGINTESSSYGVDFDNVASYWKHDAGDDWLKLHPKEYNPDNISSAFKIWPKEALLAPANAIACYQKSSRFQQASVTQLNSLHTWHGWLPSGTVSTQNNKANVFTVSSVYDSLEEETDILLTSLDVDFMRKTGLINSAGDPVFEMDIEQGAPYTTQKSAFNELLLHSGSAFVWQLLIMYYGDQSANKCVKFEGADRSYSNERGDKIKELFMLAGANHPLIKFLLKNCYVWVKCPFFADYITYDDFNQRMSQTDDVQHKSMIVGSGDFKRYNNAYKTELQNVGFDDSASSKSPYMPKTVPSVDLLSETLVPKIVVDDPKDYKQKYVDALKEDLEENLYTKIGKPLIQPLTPIGYKKNPLNLQDGELVNNKENFALDDDFVADEGQKVPFMYLDPDQRIKDYSEERDLPVVVPKDGNLIIEGRIFSPTIDELWVAIKQLAGGRTGGQEGSADLAKALGGYPVGDDVVENTSFKLKEFDFGENEENVVAGGGTAVWGDPLEIEYVLPDIQIDKERDPSDGKAEFKVTKYVKNPDKLQYKELQELEDISATIAKSYLTEGDKEPLEKYILSKMEISKKHLDRYDVNSYVFSNKEIEAILKGFRYNIEKFYRVLQKTMVRVGPLRGIEQLHHSFGNNDNTSVEPGDVLNYENYMTTRTVEVADNVNSISVDEPEAVYLGADNKWHSTAQLCYIPKVSKPY